MISVEEFLAAHPAPAAQDGGARGSADSGRDVGGSAPAVDGSDSPSGRRAGHAAAQAIADGGMAMDSDVDTDVDASGAMSADMDAPGPVSRFGGVFGASGDDDGRRARGGRGGDGRRRSASGFAYTPTDDPHDEERCKEAALRMLDAAARSTGALRAKLVERGYADDVVAKVVDRLSELRLLDDEEYARSVARSCANRMMGMRGAVIEMTRKGVDRALAMRIASEADDDGVFVDAAWALGRAVAARTRGKDAQVARRRFWGAGGRKGHDPQTLREVGDALFRAQGDDGEGE
ncbi:RecX-like protein [Bifidobacterium italicum]|uniref:Regulatory protein RecX n=1 Tax=Bifidobacterium italicum TaxID=1960968 RepID=A0A2A2EHI2_9BIFI|nr:regulatory protein RecX [Bifidobacterium italicum]PAU68513.1 RecX-like protein [Bifidobacterium italicum]